MNADSDLPRTHCDPQAARQPHKDVAERIGLSERDTRIVLELIDNPHVVNDRMVAALKAMPVETLPDETVVRVDQETFDSFLSVLDEPPSGPGYERLTHVPRPWES